VIFTQIHQDEPTPKERNQGDFSGIASATNDVQSGSNNTISPTTTLLKAFAEVVAFISTLHVADPSRIDPSLREIIDESIHFRVQSALVSISSIFLQFTEICTCQMIFDQADQDNTIRELLEKLSEVYDFMTEDERLAEIPSMQTVYGKMTRQALECAHFIAHYPERKSVCESRLLHCCLTFNVVPLHRKKTWQGHLQRNRCHHSELQ
jgi:hypothetical protein